jgi:hypothetical protein
MGGGAASIFNPGKVMSKITDGIGLTDSSKGEMFGSSVMFDLFAPPTQKLYSMGEQKAAQAQQDAQGEIDRTLAAAAAANAAFEANRLKDQSPGDERATMKIGTGSGSLLGSLGLIVEPTTGRQTGIGLNLPSNTTGLGFGTKTTGATK